MIQETLTAAASAPSAEFKVNEGWVLIALQNAFYHLLHAPSREAGVVDTMMRGDDADAYAANHTTRVSERKGGPRGHSVRAVS